MRRSLLLFLCLIFVAVPLPVLASPLDDLVADALRENPSLAAMREKILQSSMTGVTASALEDPKIALALNNYPVDTLAGDESPMTGKMIKFSQSFPYPGKRDARRDMFDAQSDMNLALYREAALGLVRDVKSAWYDLEYQRKSLAIIKTNRALTADLARVMETRYAVGKGSQPDVLRVQLRQSRLHDMELSARLSLRQAQIAMNRLLNRPPDAEIPDGPVELPAQIELKEVDLEEVRPAFAGVRALMRQAKTQERLAGLSSRPNFSFGAGYTFREESPMYESPDLISVEFGMTLPFTNSGRIRAERSDAASKMRSAEDEYLNLINEERRKLADVDAAINQLQERDRLYRDGIVPQTRQYYRSTLAAYEVGGAEFSSMIQSLIDLFEAEREAIKTGVDLARNLVRREALTASTLPLVEDVLNTSSVKERHP